MIRSFSCAPCGEVFIDATLYTAHLVEKHIDCPPDPGEYCEICRSYYCVYLYDLEDSDGRED